MFQPFTRRAFGTALLPYRWPCKAAQLPRRPEPTTRIP